MSYNDPGPSGSSLGSGSASQLETLPPRSEYRFELEQGEKIAIRLVPGSGDAEIFGAELYPREDRWYFFGDEAKGCVCSWEGCVIEVAPPPAAAYLSLEPSPTFGPYATIHFHLEKARLRARDALRSNPQTVHDLRALSESSDDANADVYRPDAQGPRILLLGPEASGKSSLAKMLCNYALRSPATTSVGAGEGEEQEQRERARQGEVEESEPTGWWPMLVNLDPAVGAPPLPCTISAHPLTPLPQAALTSASPTLPFGLTPPVSGSLPPTAASAKASHGLSLWLGRETFRENDEHARAILEELALATERRMCRDPKARISGMIIDTMGTTSADARTKYALVRDIVRRFHVDMVLVLGQEKVTIDLTRIFAAEKDMLNPVPTVLKLPKSGGVVEPDEGYAARLRQAQVRAYFYGGSSGSGKRKAEDGSGGGEDGSGGVSGPSSSSSLSASDREALSRIPGWDDPLGGLGHLNPHIQTIPLDLLEVYRVGQETLAPSSALPIGASRALSASTLHKLDALNSAADQASLLNSVLALVDPPGSTGGGGKGERDSEVWLAEMGEEEGERRVARAVVRGFVHVQAIDASRKRMTVLSPSAGRLPSKTALLGTLDWQDA